MRKRMQIGLGGVAIVLVATVVGLIVTGTLPVFAANSGNTSGTPSAATGQNGYCTLYINTLAKELNVSPSQLSQDNQNALRAVIDRMAADGRITAAQKARMEKRLANFAKHPCASLAARHFLRAHPALVRALQGARIQLGKAVAQALNLTPAQLKADLQAGQTIQQLAASQKVQLSTVQSAYLNEAKTLLAQAVSNDKLTQAQSNALYNRLQTAVKNGRFPLLGARADQAAQSSAATATAQASQ